MEWYIIIALFAGFMLGLGAAFLFRIINTGSASRIVQEVIRDNEARQASNQDTMIEQLKESFGNLSLEALTRSTEEFLKLAKARFDSEREMNSRELEGKKVLIDDQLKGMKVELDNVSTLVKELERDRVAKFGELTGQLKNVHEQTALLTKTTNSLREAFASTKSRGQWGERMVEDVLKVAGFIENINYHKQKTIEGIGTRPDFTFILPKDLKLNMDVKFPLDNYMKYLEAEMPQQKAVFRNSFLKDVKARIREVTTREYINPEQNTLDYVLLFIPNEQIYTFIMEQDSTIIDMGIENRVVLCSPFTLFAVLAVIRQAIENFALEQTSNEILSLLGQFNKQWDAFLKKLHVLGNRIKDSQKEYEILTTTRKRQLEKPLKKIEELRVSRQITEEQLPLEEDQK